jgi:uncharacterized protein (TIGR00661 family)
MTNKTHKKVLVAPLDWGLGHTVRCIPIIEALLQKGCQVFVAATGHHQILLQQTFSDLQYLEIPNYNIRYGKTATLTKLKYLFQLPGILRTIKAEHQWLQSIQEQYQFDLIISDNRYGLYHPSCTCIFITHQLAPIVPVWQSLVQKKLYNFINKFSQCWVADHQGTSAVAPALSQPALMPTIPTQYIGTISRFSNPKANITEKKYKACFVLSGPEPQRSIFEKLILTSLPPDELFILVRGTSNKQNHALPSYIETIDLASQTQLANIIHQSEYLISRSGYTSVMDWLHLNTKAIVVATPAQYEQEYLAKLLHQQNIMLAIPQKDFTVISALQLANSFTFSNNQMHNNDAMLAAINQLLP